MTILKIKLFSEEEKQKADETLQTLLLVKNKTIEQQENGHVASISRLCSLSSNNVRSPACTDMLKGTYSGLQTKPGPLKRRDGMRFSCDIYY